jgi:UDP-N-acetylmuramate dehydrogenase
MIQQNTSLLPFNTFGIDAKATFFTEVFSVSELETALQSGIRPVLVLGGGSNMLLTKDVEGLVVKNSIGSIQVLEGEGNTVHIKAGAGVVWHDLVCWAVEHNFGGIENLSLIPGTVGASPVQNIGAYGVELKDVFVKLEAVELNTGTIKVFDREACRFGYRDSVFKHEEKGKYCITSVTFALTRNEHFLNYAYGDIRKTLETNNITEPTIADISRAIIQIRSSKLPDPAKIGNCGSFFKNPETARFVLDKIMETHPQVVSYDLPDGRVKIPAGWLIEQCGWKGKRVGNTGCYEKQALVLVNHGGATGEEVKKLAYDIIDSVDKTFGIRLEPEVNII